MMRILLTQRSPQVENQMVWILSYSFPDIFSIDFNRY